MEAQGVGNEPYENLIIAIIKQASTDYCDAVRKLKEDQNNKKAQDVKQQCEKFLRHGLEMYEPFISVSGDYILRELNLRLEKRTSKKKYRTCCV